MYQPAHFRTEDRDAMVAMMRAHPFATLITLTGGRPVADLLPLLVVEDGDQLLLRGHVARANPLWKSHDAGADVLAVFQGPEAYVTPSWYATKRETGKVVPTWNYAVVQARGAVRMIDDVAWLLDHVADMTDRMEADRPAPWKVSDAPESFVNALARGIIGIEIAITELDGKMKLSQNRPEADRIGVVDGLAAEGSERAVAMAEAVAAGAYRPNA